MRAQVSLDLILAIAIGIAAIGAITVVGAQVISMQTESSVRQQLDSIGTGLASAVSASAILDDADSASLNLDIPRLLVPGEEKPQPCSISIDSDTDTITLSYTIVDLETGTELPVTVSKNYVAPANMNVPENAQCGQTLTITG